LFPLFATEGKFTTVVVDTSVVDPHHFDADPVANPDSTYPRCGSGFWFLFDADADPTFHPDADVDPDPKFSLDPDPDPAFLVRIRPKW
jgi:hypothetical protein